MKNILLIALLIFFKSCNAQKQSKNKDSIKYYNIDEYKDWDFDPEHCNPKYNKKCSREDSYVYLAKDNNRVEIYHNDEIVSVEKSNFIDPYIYLDIYNKKTKLQTASYKYFLSTAREPIGISREYDDNGKLVKEENWDKPYKFTIEDMVKKFKEEYNVDILNRKNIFRFYRYENSKTLGIPLYKIYLNTEIGNKWMQYLVDGNTGKTLYIMKYSEGDDTDIFEEYLKSIGKFKGRTYKSNPSIE